MIVNSELFSSDHNTVGYPHVAVVILNYNAERDLQVCADQIAQQIGIHFSIILVDNASRTESLALIRSWLSAWRPDAVCGTEEDVQTWVRQNPERAQQSGNVYLIQNSINKGYSGGNNIGIRLADTLKADAVLISNPDMRIEHRNYIGELFRHMFDDSSNYVAASRIIGLDGVDQNPLREASFWEEIFWPGWLARRFLKTKSYLITCLHEQPIIVHKVSGCCMLIRMNFLRSTNGLDENVFLYCEEPILSARVHSGGGRILYVPKVLAIHAHVSGQKGNVGKRMLSFIKSRRYYLKTYSGYPWWQLQLLFAFYSALAFFNRLRGFLGK